MSDDKLHKIPTQGVHHVTLVGADRQSSIDVWEGLPAMPFVFEQPNLDNPAESHLYFDPGDGRLITVFTNEDRVADASRTPTGAGAVHRLAFRVSQAVFDTDTTTRTTSRAVLAGGASAALAAQLPLSALASSGDTTMTATQTSKIVTAAGRRDIPFPLHPISQIVASTDMPSKVSFFHSAIPAGAPGAPPHLHEHEDEIYFILDGTAQFLLGDRVETAGPGDAVILPRGEFHANWNEGDVPVTSIVFVSQDSRFEDFFDDVARRIIEQGIENPMEAAKVVGMTGAEYGVTIDMSKTPDRAKPFFGL